MRSEDYALCSPVGGTIGMAEYRAYLLGRDGHFNGFEPLVCPDDATALAQAKRLFNRYGIELWSGVRLVERLSPATGCQPIPKPYRPSADESP
jgi:hypothetical protein